MRFCDETKGRLAGSRSESLFLELKPLVSGTNHVLVIHLPDLHAPEGCRLVLHFLQILPCSERFQAMVLRTLDQLFGNGRASGYLEIKQTP